MIVNIVHLLQYLLPILSIHVHTHLKIGYDQTEVVKKLHTSNSSRVILNNKI